METERVNYRQILGEELERRCKRNPSYSLRSFARDLNLSVGSISKVLSGKQGLSASKAKQISKLLDLGDSETELFCTLVESSHARAKVNRDLALKRLSSNPITNLSLKWPISSGVSPIN